MAISVLFVIKNIVWDKPHQEIDNLKNDLQKLQNCTKKKYCSYKRDYLIAVHFRFRKANLWILLSLMLGVKFWNFVMTNMLF